MNEEELKKTATEEMDRLRYVGYRGNFTAFGVPYCTHGDTITLKDSEYPEKDGIYFVDKIIVRSGINGFRRTIYLGKKAL